MSAFAIALRIMTVGVALTVAFVGVGERTVERWFSLAWYPAVQRLLTGAANRVPWSLFDASLVAFGMALAVAIVGRVRGARGRARRYRWWLAALDVAALCAAVYLVFMTTWGWNYRRAPLASRFATVEASTVDARVDALVITAVGQLNLLHAEAHATPWPRDGGWNGDLAEAFRVAQLSLGMTSPAVAARPKSTVLGWWFERAGIAGLTNPFQLDVALSPAALDVERPALLAHEWGHIAGFAREDEAGLVGFVTTQQGSAQARYSGWLDVYPRLLAAVPGDRRRVVHATLAAGPRADLADIARRLERVSPTAHRLAWSGYDSYLRSNRVSEGVAAYDRVVLLMARTAFDERWRPRLVGR